MKNVITALLASALAVAAILFISIPDDKVTVADSNASHTVVK
jgi:hypothetical protein